MSGFSELQRTAVEFTQEDAMQEQDMEEDHNSWIKIIFKNVSFFTFDNLKLDTDSIVTM